MNVAGKILSTLHATVPIPLCLPTLQLASPLSLPCRTWDCKLPQTETRDFCIEGGLCTKPSRAAALSSGQFCRNITFVQQRSPSPSSIDYPHPAPPVSKQQENLTPWHLLTVDEKKSRWLIEWCGSALSTSYWTGGNLGLKVFLSNRDWPTAHMSLGPAWGQRLPQPTWNTAGPHPGPLQELAFEVWLWQNPS